MAARRKALGRGLDALIDTGGSSTKPAGIQSLGIDKLEPNRYQPRSAFDEAGLDELAQSIQAQGVVQPIIVTPDKGDKYRIIAGERRWRAARKIGLEEVPVVVRDIQDDQQMLELALVENVQRADLNVIEEAEAYRTLGERFDLSQEEIATRVGKGRTTITNTLRLLRLPNEIQDYLREGRLTAGQARPLLALTGKTQQMEIADQAIEKGMTARELEALAGAKKSARRTEAVTKRTRAEDDVHTRAAAEKLTRVLQTKVEIIRRRQGGRIQIHFSSEDELIRIYESIVQDTKDG